MWLDVQEWMIEANRDFGIWVFLGVSAVVMLFRRLRDGIERRRTARLIREEQEEEERRMAARKQRALEALEAQRQRVEQARLIEGKRQRQTWYSIAFRKLCVDEPDCMKRLRPDEFDGLTILQACSMLGCGLPEFGLDNGQKRMGEWLA